MDYLTTHTSLSPIWHGFAPGFVNYKKGCTRLAASIDKVYQLLAHGRWFSLGTPASSTTKTGRHDIAESGIKHQKSINQSIKSGLPLFTYGSLYSYLIFGVTGACIKFYNTGYIYEGITNSQTRLSQIQKYRFFFTYTGVNKSWTTSLAQG